MPIELFQLVFFASKALIAVIALAWIISLFKKDNSIMDVFYGLGFIALALYTYFCADMPQDLRATIVTLCTVLWGTRLSYRIMSRNQLNGEDYRYQAWRREWMKRGTLYFYIRSFFQIFVMQGIIILAIALPIIFANTLSGPTFSFINLLGFVIWIIGFYFEVRADSELDHFLKYRHPVNRILQTGLWKYSRHPNYFGEALMWWGMLILIAGLPYWYVALLSPILITYLLRFVSGVPLLEHRFAHDPDYQEYARKTNVFIPWFRTR